MQRVKCVRAREKSCRITFKAATRGYDRVRGTDKVNRQGTKKRVRSSRRN